MLYRIISFHKTELGPYNLVFSHFKWQYRMFLVTGLLSCMMAFVSSILYIRSGWACWTTVAVIVLAVTSCGFGVLFFALNKRAKAILMGKYKLQQEEFLWGGQPFWEMRCSLLMDYLKKHGLCSRELICFLIDSLSREINSKRSLRLKIGAIAISLLVVIWSEPIRFLYSESRTPRQIFALAIALTIALSLAALIWQILRIGMESILERDIEQMKELQSLLQDGYLTFQQDK